MLVVVAWVRVAGTLGVGRVDCAEEVEGAGCSRGSDADGGHYGGGIGVEWGGARV